MPDTSIWDESERVRPARFNPVRVALAARRDWLYALDTLSGEGRQAPLLSPGWGLPVLVVQDGEAARQVLIADASSYGRPWLVRTIMAEALGKTLFLAEGDEWLARRQVIAPAFDRSHVDGVARIMASVLAEVIERWRPGRAEDLQADLTALTVQVACRALFGVDADDGGLGTALRDSFEVVLAWMAYRFGHLTAPPAVVPTARNRAMKKARADLRDCVRRLVHERHGATGEADDVLSLLVRNQQIERSPSEEEIVNDCVGFLFAGHETTASTLTWAAYELAKRPALQAKVAAEGDTLDLDRQDLFRATEELDYTGRVVNETLRLYPAGVGIARVAKRTTNISGHRVRRGTTVLIAVYSMQRRSPWVNGEEFDPERKFPSQPGGEGTPAYLPFGWGPRRCLGARVATTEARLALAMVCSRWTLSYRDSQPPRAAVLPSLRVDGPLPIHLEARSTRA